MNLGPLAGLGGSSKLAPFLFRLIFILVDEHHPQDAEESSASMTSRSRQEHEDCGGNDGPVLGEAGVQAVPEASL